jgi:hypothetical protein
MDVVVECSPAYTYFLADIVNMYRTAFSLHNIVMLWIAPNLQDLPLFFNKTYIKSM